MREQPVKLITSLIFLSGIISACGGVSSPPLAGEVETRVAATFQAGDDTTQLQTEIGSPTATILQTVMPAQVFSQGSFSPYGMDQCEQMRMMIEQSVGVPAVIETTPFNDHVGGGAGTACRIHASGNGTMLSMDVFNTVDSFIRDQGWQWDSNYGAAGPTGLMEGYRKRSAIGLLSVSWQPSSRDLCPADQPIGACVLTPEQKLFEVTFDIAQLVVYIPLWDDQCTGWLTTLQPSISVPLVLETVNFNDMEGNFGTACQVHGAGTGLDFSNFMDTANALDSVLVSLGWTLGNGADGPTGTAREYSNGSQTAIVTVTWQPSAEADCPTDQPIGACNLSLEQRLYSLTVAFAQK
jgi:hypothetical protein